MHDYSDYVNILPKIIQVTKIQLIIYFTGDVKGEQRSLIAKRGRILQDEVSSNVPFPCNVTGNTRSKTLLDFVH